MESKNWKKIKEILLEAVDIDVDERQSFLENLELDEDIRKEIDSLLAFEEKADDWEPYNAIELAKETFEEEAIISLIGQKVGNYKIVREIGFGGMGAVYLGERADGKFEQLVAIKMLKREFNTSAVRRRFKKESEIQAKLNNPNIARLIDTGTTADGIPYLVMEYIEGERIDRYCQNKKLNLEQILKLFNKVGDAVSFAHQHLIVHRDLKPSNILITKTGEPKLLDFGISKLIDEEIEEKHTVTNMGVMTPEYASPEQVSGQSVTTATDIYSLGVILFELLSGHRPFEKEYSKRKNILKAIIEDEPQNPSDILIQFQSTYFEKIDTKPNLYSDSDKFADTDDDGIKTKQMSDKDTKELSNNTKLQFLDINPKKLRGDLDNIILKALRKETNRRYQTVEQFTADIWRFLDGLPVTARPSTFGYRASKFFKRNQTGVVAVSLIILAILGGVIATLWQASQTQAEAAKAQKINKFLQNVLNFSNPHWLSSNPKRNREATIADALDESLKNIDKDLADEPEVKAELLLTIGKTYLGQGQYSKAEELIQKSVSLFDGVYGSENTKSMQARVLLGDTLYVQSKFDKSVENYNQAINYLRPRINQDEDTRKYLAIALTDLGNIVSAQGNLDDAEKLNLESLELAQKLKGKDRFIIPIVIANLGTQERRRGNFKKALDYYKQSEAEIISQGNEESDNMGATKRVIGETYRDLKNYEKAEEYFDRSYEVLKKSVGEKNIYTLQTKVRLAQLYFDQGEYEKSKKVVENQLEIQREMFPDGHFLTGLLQITLGKIHTKQGRLKEGEDEIRKSLKYFSENRKEPNPDIAYAKAALGVNLIEQNKKAEGRELLESALQGYAKTSGENHPDTKGVREELERLSK